ncbi:vascular endothelial growth factor A, long form isoform X6 [Pseudophryne corroboree]|uniref:vascular endothelial growth factor A, long form isoform X6 n=1 Tax=Pseudophryne corroboree TaxID=495146 RepID=UPI0030815541
MSLLLLFHAQLLYFLIQKPAYISREERKSDYILSRAAPPHEREQKPTEVVMFSKVYERSVCQVREVLVDIYQEYPDEVEYIYKPSCVPLMRCAGCCLDETLECAPTDFHNVTMQIARFKPHVSNVYVHKSFLQHSHCECRQKKEIRGKQENPCEPCTDTERRKHLFVQDPQTCKCSCKNTDSRCKTRQLELNERTCRCEKPRR